MISALALVVKAISCYYRKLAWNTASISPVRKLFAKALAESLLGHPFDISGRVVHGDELGRTIGFPTANVPLRRQVSPVKGVYAVEVLGLGEKPLPGVANIGTRPTVAGIRQQLEVHLLDVAMDLYGRHIQVVLRKKIRNEQRFASLDELKAQIARDELTAREFFGLTKPA